MTEPDEALLYAREQLANTWRKDGAPSKAVAAALAGEFDDVLGLAAHDYRAGAAASAERIKALEGAVRSLIGIIDSNGLMHDPVYPPLGFSKRHDGQPVVDGVKQARRAVNEARALLKEATTIRRPYGD